MKGGSETLSNLPWKCEWYKMWTSGLNCNTVSELIDWRESDTLRKMG